MRGQKGITLVALIITIVVLLILAVVSITAVTDDGVLDHAQNAAAAWNQSAQDEQSTITNYMNKIQDYGF